MTVAWTLARAGLRHRLRGLVGLAVVLAIGMGVSLAAFEVATRTENGFASYLAQANVGELVVNPSLSDARATELITTTPGVTGFATDDFLLAGIDAGRPLTQAEIDSTGVQVRMSSDVRYVEQDRPVVHEGRMLRDGAEVFLNRHAADELGLEVGAEITLAFFRPSFNTPGVNPARDEVVEPIGRATGRVVGIGTFAGDVLQDDLYPQSVMLITPGVGGRFTCTFNPIITDRDMTVVEHLLAIFPTDCALSYRYYSLQIAGGDAAVGTVADALVDRFEQENQSLPPVLLENDIGYSLIPTSTSDERTRVEQSLQPAVTALRLFGLVAGLASVVLALLSGLRIARQEQAHQDIWRQLGVTRPQRSLALAMPLAASLAVGLLGAVALGLAGSGIGAVGSVRVLEPDPRYALSGSIVAGVAGSTTAALLAGVIAIAWVVARAPAAPAAQRPSTLLRISRRVHPARGLGMRAAIGGVGARVVVAGSVAAVLATVASLVFATSVNALVATPARYGWPYDLGVIIGYGYGGADADAIATSLDRPEVEHWGLAALGSVTIEGKSVASVAARENFSGLRTPLIEGERPDGAGEIALGAETADELGIDVGQSVSVVTAYGEAPARVTGLVVLPPVGPYQSDRAATGRGAFLSERFFADLLAGAEKEQGLPAGSLDATGPGSFLAIDLADGVDVDVFLASIDGDERVTWDRNDFDSFFYPEPVRPAAIADVASMRRLPIGLGAFFALAMAAGLVTGIEVATRARRRELAILRSLGCTPRQVASSVRWHALTVASLAIAVGLPLGLAAGRVLYRNFAVDIGVVTTIDASVLAMTGAAVGTIVVALFASALPAHRISRTRLASFLRQE